MKSRPPYILAEGAVKELRSIVEQGTSRLHAPIVGTESLVNDIYTGRDPGSGTTSISGTRLPFSGLVVDADSTRTWRPPETTANLFLSRLRQITTTIAPGKPSFHCRPRVAGAAPQAEDQNTISDFLAQHGDLKGAMRRAGFLGLLSTHFGAKLVIKPKDMAEGPWDRLTYIALGPRECGFDPGHRRALWHTYFKPWGELPPAWRPQDLEFEDWEMVRVTEVYHAGFRHGHPDAREYKSCPLSVFVAAESRDESTQDRERSLPDGAFDLGEYQGTWNKPACPIVIKSMLEPAPGEDVAPAEVLSWIPLMRKIVQTLVQIDREVRTVNNVILYRKGAFTDEDIDYLRSALPSERVFIAVDSDDSENGVNATMRPVEQATYLSELLATLQQYLALFDDVTGVGPMDRGVPMNPRKSATEAQSITANSNRRNKDRLEVMASMWSELLLAQFKYQREIFGSTIDIPQDRGIVRRLDVPDPAASQFLFDVDPVELGHLSKQGDAETVFNATQLLGNLFAQYQGSIPKPVREMARRTLVTMGIADADALIDAPTLDVGPQDRFMESLLNPGKGIPVRPDDQHEMYVAYYEAQRESLDLAHPAQIELEQAIMEHNVFIRRAAAARINPAAQPNVVPGFGPNGADNSIQPSLDLNEPLPFTLTGGR